MRWGTDLAEKRDLSSLRLLARSASPSIRGVGLVHRYIGGESAVVDTWWQTETGAIMITRCPA